MSKDRETALLTPAQRKYLHGDSDIKKKSSHERAVRSRIRNRVRNGVFDLALLHHYIETRDLKMAFDDDNSGKPPEEMRHILNNTSSAIALIFDGVILSSGYEYTPVGESPDNDIHTMLSEFIETAIENIYVNRGENVEDVNVTIDTEFGTPLSETPTDDLTSLSGETLDRLFRAGEITKRQWITALYNIYAGNVISTNPSEDIDAIISDEDNDDE